VVRRVLYGAFFALVLPVGLALWARATSPIIPLHAIHSVPAAAALIGAGLLLCGAGIFELIVHGHGLPMNPFPPKELVRRGIFRWIRNPIYIGFGLCVAGVSIGVGSSAGLWLVTPVVGLGAAGLVFGFERHDLRARFGDSALDPPLLSLPRGDGDAPTAAQRAAVWLWVLVPWLIAYYAVQAVGRAPDAFPMALGFEKTWPVFQWTELFYASTYLFIPLTSLLIRTAAELRRFAVRGAIATAVVTTCWLVIPVVATNRPFEPGNMLGRLLAFEQGASRGVAAFPAFHVLWALIAAEGWHGNGRTSGRSWWTWIGWTWAALITVSCITTGMHTLPEVAAAMLLFLPLLKYRAVWESVRRATERLANSWKEWQFGPVRIISYGAWAAAGAGAGLVIAGSAAGSDRFAAVGWVALCILVGSGLWAQLVEGSAKLLRPFGWYGGLIGGVFGALTARLAGIPVVPLMAAFVIAAPWVQMLGRLRCLVQGCCHGRLAPPEVGIRYRHPRSRVTQLANLANLPIHATPLYSIVSNLLIGVVLLRLRSLATPDSLLLGIYLILAGIARFVEESYRGEPQTPVIGGLHSYQWLALVSLTMGIGCTLLPAIPPPVRFSTPTASLLGAGLAMAVLSGVAMGVDFPRWNRRFSRLAPVDALQPAERPIGS
jgi:protein-S-isoprenylcysteine O-methyltransferase Ste14